MAVLKKAKRKVTQEKWHVEMGCLVKVLSSGHFPTTVMVELPNGSKVETDLDYLADPN